MRTKAKERFITVRSEGGLLPVDFLQKIALLDSDVEGLRPDDYHLLEREKINEAINRAWDRLLGCWVSFRSALKGAASDDPLTKETRERWLLPLFDALGYGRLVTSKAIDVEGKTFAISHMWQKTPIHLVGYGVELDRRTSGVAGAAKSAPHGMVQDFLNRSSDHLWAFLSNGKKLRILRDNVSLTRQSFVEFDLEGMMDGEQFADFRLLWLLCHESRVEAEVPEQCWLEKWSKAAVDSGIRVRDQLRRGVEEAIRILGTGFLQHPANNSLRTKLKGTAISSEDFYRQLLRIVYRLLFLFVAEDRDVLIRPDASIEQKMRYANFYSTRRVRVLAGLRRGGQHSDLWHAQCLVSSLLGNDGCLELGLPALGSFLWNDGSVADLVDCNLTNRVYLDVIRALSFAQDGQARRPVDFKNLRTEELGSIYEALLEMHPRVDIAAYIFELSSASGNERKTTGSYYTPPALVAALLDSTLDPVLNTVSADTSAENKILALKVCDPACGSGHFLIAAAHRLARKLAAVRSEDSEPNPQSYRIALRDVISRCIYGVDVNEMAVELCKVSLWIESLTPGSPLSFLDHKIKCGNSLIGALPGLLAGGIPDDAFAAIEGDDKSIVSEYRTKNKKQKKPILSHAVEKFRQAYLQRLNTIESMADRNIADLHRKESAYQALMETDEYRGQLLIANAWCAAFVCLKTKESPEPVTNDLLGRLAFDVDSIDPKILSQINDLARSYKFFHWALEFPQVFSSNNRESGDNGEIIEADFSKGFDVIIGNPPWDQLQLDAREFFAFKAPDVAKAANLAARTKAIEQLKIDNPHLHAKYSEEKRRNEGIQQFVHASGRYPLTSYGRLNSAPLFVEAGRGILSSRGRLGLIVPTGIAFDSFNQYFFNDIMKSRQLASLHSFENEEFIFPAVHHSTRFCILTIAGREFPVESPDFVFLARQVSDLKDEHRHFTLSLDDTRLLNPNTRTCAIFRSRQDAELTKDIYRYVPALVIEDAGEDGNPWGFSGLIMFMMNTDSKLFKNRSQLEKSGWKSSGTVFVSPDNKEQYIPLYEGKMIHQFDHRFGTYFGQTEAQANQGKLPELTESEHANPAQTVLPRYWVSQAEINQKLGNRWSRSWLVGWRDITSSVTTRTVIASVVPRVGCGDTLLLMFPAEDHARLFPALVACLNSFVLDYAARQKIGGTHLKYHVFKQLPILPPEAFMATCKWSNKSESVAQWMEPRILELIYTAEDMRGFAKDMEFDGPPFVWNEERRHHIRCELDAAFFQLYKRKREEIEYIMSTFPLVRRRDEAKSGEFKTKNLILDYFDAMSAAISKQPKHMQLPDPST